MGSGTGVAALVALLQTRGDVARDSLVGAVDAAYSAAQRARAAAAGRGPGTAPARGHTTPARALRARTRFHGVPAVDPVRRPLLLHGARARHDRAVATGHAAR